MTSNENPQTFLRQRVFDPFEKKILNIYNCADKSKRVQTNATNLRNA